MAGQQKATKTAPGRRSTDLYFKITLSHVPSGFPPPSCQVAIDVDENGSPEDGEFVNLRQVDFTWSGMYTFPGTDPVGKRIMVGLMGCLHAKYKVEVHRDSDSGPLLVDDSGTVREDPDGFILWLEKR